MKKAPISVKFMVLALFLSVVASGIAQSNDTGGEWDKGACKADAEKLCTSVSAGHGAIRECLKQHEGQLSASCKGNIAMAKEKMKKHKEEIQLACKADQDQFCKDITPGEGREMACLHAHSDKLSAGCKEVFQKMHKHMGHSGHSMPSTK